MISCVVCTHFTLRDVGEMARRGCGHCAHDATYSYYPGLAERECSKYEPVDMGVAGKRREWLERSKK